MRRLCFKLEVPSPIGRSCPRLGNFVSDREPPSVRQAVEEVLATMEPVFAKHPEMIDVVERLVEPERMIAFRVAWIDDAGKQHVRTLLMLFCVYTFPGAQSSGSSRLIISHSRSGLVPFP